jgi:hypothetical protein
LEKVLFCHRFWLELQPKEILEFLQLSWQLKLCSHFFIQLFFRSIFILKLKLEQQVQLPEQLEQLEMLQQQEQSLELLMLELGLVQL